VRQVRAAQAALNLSDELVQQMALLAARLPVPAPKKYKDDDGRWHTDARFYSVPQLMAAAERELRTGQQCQRDFYLDPDMGMIEGYRSRQFEIGERFDDVLTRERRMTPDEMEDFGVEPEDVAYICEAFSQASGKTLSTGYGVLTYAELWQTEEWTTEGGRRVKKTLKEPKPIYPTPGRPRFWKAIKRARSDALDKLAGLRPTRGDDLLRMAQRFGINVDLTDRQRAALTTDQARAYLRSLEQAEHAQLVAAGQAAPVISVEKRAALDQERDGFAMMSDREQDEYRAARQQTAQLPAQQPEPVQAAKEAEQPDGDDAEGGEQGNGATSEQPGIDQATFAKMVAYALNKRAYDDPADADAALSAAIDLHEQGEIGDLREYWLQHIASRVAAQE
jgi:hypothetical protein